MSLQTTDLYDSVANAAERGEKLIWLNKDNVKDKPIIQGAEKYKDDGTIHIFAHGSSKSISVTIDGKTQTVKNANQLDKLLSKHSEVWQNRQEGDNVTIVLHSCRKGEGESSFAQEISGKLDGVTVIAPDQRDYFTSEGEMGAYKAKYAKENGDYKVDANGQVKSKERSNETGNWRVFKGGKETESYKGDWKPKENPSWWDKLWNKN